MGRLMLVLGMISVIEILVVVWYGLYRAESIPLDLEEDVGL